jgi:hypothetical protein
MSATNIASKCRIATIEFDHAVILAHDANLDGSNFRKGQVRAQSMRGRMAMLGLYLRQGAPWLADLRSELLSFPAARDDDQVDALGLVGQPLDKISAGRRPTPANVGPRDRYNFDDKPTGKQLRRKQLRRKA